jgi:hypothetical protein
MVEEPPRDHLILGRLAKAWLDQVGPAVALAAGKPLADELGAVRLQVDRAEISDQDRAVELPQDFEQEADHPDLVRRLVVLDVVLFTVAEIPSDYLVRTTGQNLWTNSLGLS